MKDWIEFLSNPSSLSLLALAILGTLYLVKLALDFLNTVILPKVYERHLQKKKITLPYASKILDTGWDKAEYFRDGNPKYIDFLEGRIYKRPEFLALDSLLTKGRFAQVIGPPSSGKTVILLNIAYSMQKTKRNVLYFNRPATISDAFFNFLSAPEAAKLFDNPKSLIIIDDVHLDVARCSRLFSFIYGNFSHLKLVFVSRPYRPENEAIEETWHYDYNGFMPSVDIKSDTSLNQLANHYSQHKYKINIPPSILSAFLAECGNDLLLLGRYLREWDGNPNISLFDIRDKVFRKTIARGCSSSFKRLSASSMVLINVSLSTIAFGGGFSEREYRNCLHCVPRLMA